MPLLFVCPCVIPNLIIQIHKLMGIKKKEIYKAPEAEAQELEIEGVVCQSLQDPADYPEMPDPFAF